MTEGRYNSGVSGSRSTNFVFRGCLKNSSVCSVSRSEINLPVCFLRLREHPFFPFLTHIDLPRIIPTGLNGFSNIFKQAS